MNDNAKVFSLIEMREMMIDTSDYQMMEEVGEFTGTLEMKAQGHKKSIRIFLTLDDGRKIITPIFWWQTYLGFYYMPIGTKLRLFYSESNQSTPTAWRRSGCCWGGSAVSVYYAPGCLAAYAKIKKVVESCFSDRKKRPFVTIIRRGDRLMVTIYHHTGEKTENEILLEDVERLEALYNNLCRLAHWR